MIWLGDNQTLEPVTAGMQPLLAPLLALESTEEGLARFRGRAMLPEAWRSQEVSFRVSYRAGSERRSTAPRRVELNVPEISRVPAWAIGATWYQVFPERFRDGDPANNPGGPLVAPLAWNSDFSVVSVEEIERAWSRQRAGESRSHGGWNAPGGARRATIYQRRYGGDLIGLVEALPHIESLGVSAVYLCPIFESSSLHKYDASDFLHVDRAFGPAENAGTVTRPNSDWSRADRYFIDTVLPTFRGRSIRLVLDGVWNHTGLDHWAFKDVADHGRESAYADWYAVRFDSSGELVGWQAWDRTNGSLPEFRQTDEGDLNAGVSSHIFEVTRRWMDPNGDGDPSDGIDGWRLDVAPEIGMAFWEKWRRHVRSINPDAALYGEIWFDAGPWFGGKAFDAQMNYPFAVAVLEWCAGASRTSSGRLGERLMRVFSHHPSHDLAQMNLLGSHDTPRVLSMLSRPNAAYDDGETASSLGRESLTGRPSAETLGRMELAVAIQSLWLGSPMIYAGDEFGMVGPDDPDNRAPIPWPDLDSGEPGAARPDPGVLGVYQKWFRLRSYGEISDTIRYGTVHVVPTGDDGAFAFVRALNGQRVLVVANRGPRPFGAGTLLPGSMRDSSDARVPVSSTRFFVWTESANRDN